MTDLEDGDGLPSDEHMDGCAPSWEQTAGASYEMHDDDEDFVDEAAGRAPDGEEGDELGAGSRSWSS